MKTFEYIIKLQDLVSNKIAGITGSFNTFDKTVGKSQANVKRKIGKTTQSIDFLQNRLQKLDRARTASSSMSHIRKLNTEIRKTERRLRRLENLPPRSFAERLRGLGQTAGGFIGIAGGAFMVRDSFQKMETQIQAVGQVQTALASTNGVVGFSLDELQAKASELQSKSIFGDESILQNTTAQLMTFTNITGSAFERAQQAVLDVTGRLKGTKATSEDLRTTSIMLGKALNDPVANLSALSRSGIQFSDTQKEMIKGMVESGNLSKAQSLILAEIDKQYGGSAEALAKNGLGALKQFRNSVGDIQETIAASMLPFVNSIIEPLKKGAQFINNHADVLKKITPYIIGFGGALFFAKRILVGYNVVTAIVTGATKLWSGAQAVLNAVLSANPIVWVIAGIIALIAVLTYVVIKIRGWGDAWKHTVRGSELLLKSFVLQAKSDFGDLFNNMMIGINKIKSGWVRFRDAIGIGDTSQNREILAKISKDTEKRKKDIIEARNKARRAALASSSEFKKAASTLSWDKSKKFSDVKSYIAKKLGVSPSGLTPKVPIAGTPSGTTGNGNISQHQKTNRAIATGGTKHNYITLNVNKEMIGNLVINGKSFKESVNQMSEDVADGLLRVLALATTG